MTYSNQKRLVLLTACVIFITSAIFNNGFYHFDEHYQLVEFAELISGRNTPLDLAWEYDAKVRPALQPVIAHISFSFLRSIGMKDHYFLILSLRVLTAILSIVIIAYFVKKTEHLVVPALRLAYLFIAFFLWLSPVVNVRFSSETYSGLSICLAAALIFSKKESRFLMIGVLLGIGFWFRFQTAFMSMGLIAWLIFIQKADLKQVMQIVVGGFCMLVLGIAIDYWFYGNFTITFYNYYMVNIVNGVAAEFGISPWTYYFKELTATSFYPIGIIIWFSLTYQIFFNYKNFALWIILPFLIIHCIIPHKELRFLMPLINFIPLLITLTIQDIFKVHSSGALKYRIALIGGSLMILTINFSLLFMAMSSPADSEGRMNITQSIQNQYQGKKIKLWITDRDNPYKPIPEQQKFYLNNDVKAIPIDSSIAMGSFRFSNDTITLVTIRIDRLNDHADLFNAYHLNKIKSGIPEWVDWIRKHFKVRSEALVLYEVRSR